MKIIVEMKDGLVSAVYADCKDVSVDVLDYDVFEDIDLSDEWAAYYNGLADRAEQMEVVY